MTGNPPTTVATVAAKAPDLSGPDAQRLLGRAQTGLLVLQDDRIVYANDMLADLLAWPRGGLIGQPLEAAAAPGFRNQARAVIEQRLAGKEGRPGQMRCQRRDQVEFDAGVFARRVEFNGRPAVLVTLFDITELTDAIRSAQWNAHMLARTEAMCRSGSFEVFLPSGRVVLSKGLMALAALNEAAGHEGSLDTLAWIPPDEQGFVSGIWRNATPGEPFEFQHRVHGSDGRLLIVLHRGLVADEADGRGLRGVGLLQDITAQREAEMRAQDLATHDEVTGLPNRGAFLDQLDGALHAARWGGATVTLFAIDVHRIADVKTKMGFGAGDALAMALAARLQEAKGAGETVAQLSDTEFAMLLEGEGAVDGEAAIARARALVEVLQKPVRLGATDVYPVCVVGVASFPGDGDEPGVLLECAQKARLSASEAVKVVVFQPDSNQRALREMQVEAALRQALEGDELTLHYQPQVDLSDGNIIGAEALLRWTSPTLGVVSPGEFIPIAERSGLIGTVGDFVLLRACEQSAAWRKAGLRAVRIGVNLSPSQLQRPDLARQLQAVMVATGADPASIGVELTESTAMADTAHAASVLREIKAIGVEISLDDFGTGFSSLSSLRSLPIDVVKVDRSFVHDVTAAPADVSVTRAIITMAHGLHMQVLAEGVETEGQLSLLAANSCDRIQGYWFSKAVPADEFAQMVREGKHLPERFVTRARRERTLLLVDDEENILSALKRLLRRDGYHIITANGAEEGLQRMAETEVDVIISDQRMPGMTGVELLRRVKEMYPASVRMVLSGYTELQSIIDAVNEGAIYKFLTKPWDDQRLREHVAEAFRQKEMVDENRRLARQVETANADFVEVNARLQQVVAQQREQAELLTSSASNMREVFNALPVPVLGIDADSTVVFINQSAQALLQGKGVRLGGSAADMLPPAALALLSDPPGVDCTVAIGGHNHRVMSRQLLGGASPGGRLVLLVPQHLKEVS